MSLLINIVDSSRAVIADGVWVAAQRSLVEFGGTSTANATWVFLALILRIEYFTLNLNLFCWLEKNGVQKLLPQIDLFYRQER